MALPADDLAECLSKGIVAVLKSKCFHVFLRRDVGTQAKIFSNLDRLASPINGSSNILSFYELGCPNCCTFTQIKGQNYLLLLLRPRDSCESS